MPAWISLNREGLALVGGSGTYSFPTDQVGATVRLSFVDAVRAPIFPAVVAERVLAAWSRGESLPEWASEVEAQRQARSALRDSCPIVGPSSLLGMLSQIPHHAPPEPPDQADQPQLADGTPRYRRKRR